MIMSALSLSLSPAEIKKAGKKQPAACQFRVTLQFVFFQVAYM